MSNLCPRLEPDVRQTKPGERLLLRHARHGTWLELPDNLQPVIAGLDGETDLPHLERRMPRAGGTLVYHDLVWLLFQLWDRGMLADGDAVRDTLFPEQSQRTLAHARSWRRLRRLLALFRPLPPLDGLFAALGGAGRALASDITLTAAALLALVGLGLVVSKHALFPADPFQIDGSSLSALLLLYGAASALLSLRGLARGAVLAAETPVRAGLQVTAGVVHVDVEDRGAFHLPAATQTRFAVVGVLVPAGAAGLLVGLGLLLEAPVLLRLAEVGYILAFLDLCPFLATDGARLVELKSSVHKQRFRVRSFFTRRLLRGMIGAREAMADDTAYRLVATVWVVWFFAALRLFHALVLSHVLPLQVALFGAPSLAESAAAGVLFVYCVGVGTLLLAAVGVVGISMVIQLLTPERVGRPRRRATTTLTEGEQHELERRLRTLPLTAEADPAVITALVERAERLTFGRRAWLMRAGRGGRFLLMASGAAEVLRGLSDGSFQRVARLGPGDCFGEELLVGRVPLLHVRALEPVTVFSIDGEAAARLLEGSGASVLEMASFLDEVPELAGLGASGRLSLACRLQIRQVDADQTIVKIGEPADSMFLIRSGRCQVLRPDEAGRPRVIAELGAGQAFGEIGVMFDSPRTATVTAAEAGELIEVPRATLEAALRRSFQMGLALERLASRRMVPA